MKSILGNTRRPDITFYESGRIDITAHAARLLQLQRGEVLDIMSDGEEYYLYVRHRATVGRHEAMAYPSNKRGNNYRVWSHKLCSVMLQVCQTKQYVRLCVGTPMHDSQNRILLPIITKYIL